ncbi:SHOCT domain-containing protein [Nocardioides perillae]|nr:SHOCT domain-containing protein [Nocardioides perillae]
MMGWWMLGGAAAVLVVLGLAVFGVVQLLRRGHAPSAGSGPMSADEVLRRRYAAGELDEDEYERRRSTLER